MIISSPVKNSIPYDEVVVKIFCMNLSAFANISDTLSFNNMLYVENDC